MQYCFKLKCSTNITVCGILYNIPVHFLCAENLKLLSFWSSWTHVKCHKMKLYAAFLKRGARGDCLTGLTQYPPLSLRKSAEVQQVERLVLLIKNSV